MILEKDIQADIKKRLEKAGWLVIKLIQTTLNGIPDLICHRDGVTVYIEVKRRGGKVSPLQTYRIKQLESQNITVIIAYSYQDINHLCLPPSAKQPKNTSQIKSL